MPISGAPTILCRESVATAALGLIAETGRRDMHASNAVLTSQKIYCRMLGLFAGETITSVAMAVQTAASGTTPTLIKLGLVNPVTGVVLAATANVATDAKWTSTGTKSFALTTPFVVPTTGGYYVAALQNGVFGTTNLQIARQANVVGADSALPGFPRPIASGGTGMTDLTGTLTFVDLGSGEARWFGVA